MKFIETISGFFQYIVKQKPASAFDFIILLCKTKPNVDFYRINRWKTFSIAFFGGLFYCNFFFEKFLNQLSDGKMSGSRSRCSDEKIINIKCKKGKNDTRKNRKVRAVNTHQCHVENREFSGLARAIFSDFKGFQQYFFPAYYLAWCWEFCSTLFVLLLVEEQQVERSFACFCWIKSTEK